MNAACARCSKTVYPVEKLNVLDKIWHKGCFNCEICNLTLTLKTYKGYNKIPYCNTHYPVTKFTAVADTPENLRLKKNTEDRSLIRYHQDYHSSVKGTKMSVADDPESARAKKSQNQLSNQHYHGKDRTNPANTPLSRPAFSAPGVGSPTREERDDPVNIPPRSPSPEPEPPAPVEPVSAPPVEATPEEETVIGKVDYEEPPMEQETPLPPPETAPPRGKTWVAMYEYQAGDEDEVSLLEGDVITQGVAVGEGWMVGTNSRTGQHGMLPSNYVEERAA